MAEVNPPSYLQAGCYTPQQDRQAWASIICGEGVAYGACPAGGLQVVDSATGGLTVSVLAGAAFIQGDTVSCQGMYHVINDAPVDRTLSPADPTDTRVDLIVARVYDAQYSGASNEWRIEIVTGVPGAGAPAVPDNALPLAQIPVSGGATEINTSDIVDRRVGYSLCSGGDPEMVIFNAPGSQSFSKADYPHARVFKVTVVGGGGGGGGAPNTTSGGSSAGGGGGAGGSVVKIFQPEDLPPTVDFTVGAGGAAAGGSGGVGVDGSPGGQSTFHGLTANGGGGGQGGPSDGTNTATRAGGAGGTASGTGAFPTRGGAGSPGIRVSGSQATGGPGGIALYGGGGSANATGGAAGGAGQHGGGGGGAMSNNDPAFSGGVGGAGFVLIEVL